MLSATWILAQSGPVVLDVSIWTYDALPVLSTIYSESVLLKVGLYPSQLLFHVAQGRMIAQIPFETITILANRGSYPSKHSIIPSKVA